MRISYEDIRQRTVLDAGGVAIGDVETVLIDDRTWLVEAVRVRLRREMTEPLGAEKTLFRRSTIDVPTSAVQSVGDAVILQIDVAELREAVHAHEGEAAPH